MREKYQQFVIGLRAQLENIVSNEALRTIMTGRSDVNIDEHLEKGGVLAVNTALGKLRKAGDAFGQFMIMHLQNGTFRRLGTEDTRIPHFLIVDEYSRYINPDVEIFLSFAAEYKVAGIFATQSLGQLEIESGNLGPKAMKQAILTSCRNKICFGGISTQDAQDFADEFGKDKVIMRQRTYKNRILLPRLFPDFYRDTEDEEYRFDPTDLMDGIPKFNFVPRNWKELREWEEGTSFNKKIRNSLFLRFKQLVKVKKEQAVPLDQTEHMAAITLKKIDVDDEIIAVVRNVSPSLVRADIGGIEVKIPLEEIRYGWVDDLTEEVKQGDHLKFQNVKKGDCVLVRVLETDAQKEQIRTRITRVL